ncbi:MAG: TVP38/TMEM64 family protein [Anaerolineae bacterium]|nr:TVP38/TMEM64 family protein [Anaerolineae bacterium]
MIQSQTNQTPSPTFWQRHWSKAIALILWLALLGLYFWYTRQNNLTLADSVTSLADLLTNSFFGPLLYILIYAGRPLLFFPATILTLLGGFLFGPIGILYTIVGSNASAMVTFGIGWFLGEDVLKDEEKSGVIQKYTRRMRENSFETVLIMRLIFLPYDLVNYVSGFLKINWKAFLLATAVGSVPGTVSFVLFGASFGTLDELLAGEVQLNPVTVIASVVIIGISLVLSRIIKKREAGSN